MNISKYILTFWNFLYIMFLWCTVIKATYGDKRICSRKERYKDQNGKTCYRVKYICCSNYHEDEEFQCTACEKGYIRKSEQKSCTPCPNGLYGDQCIESCRCTEGQRCDNVRGCVLEESLFEGTTGVTQIDNKHTFPTQSEPQSTVNRISTLKSYETTIKNKRRKQSRVQNNITVYIICAAVISIGLIGFIYIQRHLSIFTCKKSNARVENEQRESDTNNDNAGELQRHESVYDLIDEGEL